MQQMLPGLLFALGFFMLLLTELGRVYFIMPFPGSQRSNSIELAYFIQSNLGLIRLIGIILIVYPMFQFFFFSWMLCVLAYGNFSLQ